MTRSFLAIALGATMLAGCSMEPLRVATSRGRSEAGA